MQDYRPRFGDLPDTKGKGSFCGPAAIAIVTGIDVSEIEKLVLRDRRDSLVLVPARRGEQVRGMSTGEVRIILEDDFDFVTVDLYVKRVPGKCMGKTHWSSGEPILNIPTLARWLSDTAESRGDDVFLIVTTSHFLLVCGNQIVDNQLESPRDISQCRHYRKAKIQRVVCLLKP